MPFFFQVTEPESRRHGQNAHVDFPFIRLNSLNPVPAAEDLSTTFGHYDIELADGRIAVSMEQDGQRRTRTFPIRPASSNDKGMLIGALVQTYRSLTDKDAQIQALQEQLAVATRQLFGTSSEKKPCLPVPAGEANLPEKDVPTDSIPASASDTPDQNVIPMNRCGRKPLAPGLPRKRQEHRLTDTICPTCQKELRQLPPEITEQMTVIPAQVEVTQHVRGKAVCGGCDTFVAAPMPKSMVAGSSYGSASFLAYIACNKYQLGLPYYRQEKLFHQSHVPVNRTTMAHLMNTCADLCVPLYVLMQEELLRQAIIHADETPIQVLKEPGRAATTKSFMWLYCSAVNAVRPVILFDYQETRAGIHPSTFLAGFAGYLQVDGYSGYEVFDDGTGVTRVGCMTHLRRGFVKALDAIPKEQRAQATAAWPIEKIAVLYRIEKQFANATPAERKAARQQCSLPVMNEIKAWLDRQQPLVLPKSLLGKAITYALNQWKRVMVYLDDGRLAIDNNIAERAIKDLVLGRKAWLFADQPEGAQTIAIMHSLVQTAVANGLDPYQYLLHVFEVMPSLKTSKELEQLLPWNIVLRDRVAPLELAA